MKYLTLHVSYKEATRSMVAKRNNWSNKPTKEQLDNMVLLCENVFEPLREAVGGPIYISSMFRSTKLNKALGGALNSQHQADKGAAMDLDSQVFNNWSNIKMFDYIRKNLKFDQLILENLNENSDTDWVHCSYNENYNRGQVLVMYKNNTGKTSYALFTEEQGHFLTGYKK